MLPGLKQIYVDLGYATDLNDFNASVADAELENYGTWMEFDQREFVGLNSTLKDEAGETKDWEWADTSWEEKGKVYIPSDCYSTTCRVHIAFHGCHSNADYLAYRSEYTNFAASNNIIVAFPNSFCWGLDSSYNPVDPNYMMTSEGLYI